jgi:hypothetical protein
LLIVRALYPRRLAWLPFPATYIGNDLTGFSKESGNYEVDADSPLCSAWDDQLIWRGLAFRNV